jgi:hypothetical protein
MSDPVPESRVPDRGRLGKEPRPSTVRLSGRLIQERVTREPSGEEELHDREEEEYEGEDGEDDLEGRARDRDS